MPCLDLDARIGKGRASLVLGGKKGGGEGGTFGSLSAWRDNEVVVGMAEKEKR